MTIYGLWKFLKHLKWKEHISWFRGKKIGVDASNWLSKVWGYFKKQLKKDANYKLSCSKYFHWMLRLFDFYDIKPFFVFDGRKQPLKIKSSKDIP